MGWFGPSKEEVWRKLCGEIGAEFVKGGLWKGDKLVVRVGTWTITLDAHVVSDGHSQATYTRMRAPYVNQEGFRFTICPAAEIPVRPLRSRPGRTVPDRIYL